MFSLLLIAGLAVCGLLVRRHVVRHAVPAPLEDTEARQLRAINDWQRGLRLDSRTDYGRKPADLVPMDKLQREERRQRPEEQRN
ncbi:MAG: hypothetical protein KA257_00245 [Opitutaceae bacterium]|nr:hypothetical protein [Opitutaceae bacterium]